MPAKLKVVSFFQMLAREIIRRSPASLALLLWMAVMPLVFSAFSGYQSWQHAAWLTELTYGEWAWFYLLTVFTMALALTPTTLVATVSGAFLGFSSLWYLVPSYMLASLLGYALARAIGANAMYTITEAYPKTKNVLAGLKRSELWLVILCRISPVLPFAIMNVVLSYAGIRLTQFLIGGLIGMLPRTIMAVLLGMQLETLLKGNFFALTWIALLAISLAGLGILFRKSLRQANL